MIFVIALLLVFSPLGADETTEGTLNIKTNSVDFITSDVDIPSYFLKWRPSSSIHIASPDGKEAILDFGGDSLSIGGDLPLTDAAKLFAEFTFFYMKNCYKDALSDALVMIGPTSVEIAEKERLDMMQSDLLLLRYPLSEADELKKKAKEMNKKAKEIERRDNEIIRLRKILKEGGD